MNFIRKTALVVSLLSLTAPAFASKARMQALGQDFGNGSFYIEDFRSIFLNPAYLNLKKNAVITEWGDSASKLDTDEHPKAEGGVFGDYGSFTFGLYLGNNNAGTEQVRNEKFLRQDNRVDLFVAGDAGILWGLKAYYADNDDTSDDGTVDLSNTTYGLALGTIVGDFEAYADLGLKDLSEGAITNDDKFDSDLKITAGLTYRFSQNVLNVEYRKASYDQTLSGVKTDLDNKLYSVKLGKIFSVNKTANIYADLSFYHFDLDASAGTFKGWAVPLNIAFEADLCDYVRFFGSVGQSLKSDLKVDGRKKSWKNSTSVVAGLRGHFGKFNIDGIVGRDSHGNEDGQFGTVSRIAVEYLF